MISVLYYICLNSAFPTIQTSCLCSNQPTILFQWDDPITTCNIFHRNHLEMTSFRQFKMMLNSSFKEIESNELTNHRTEYVFYLLLSVDGS